MIRVSLEFELGVRSDKHKLIVSGLWLRFNDYGKQ